MPPPPLAPGNPLIKRLARLGDGRDRREIGLFGVEGIRAISAFLSQGWQPEHLLVREGEVVPDDWPTATPVSERALARVSSATSPSGTFAAFRLLPPPVIDPTAGGVILAEVSDPGNVGTLIRTAHAMAVRQVVVLGGADPWSPKCVQASAGSVASLVILPRSVEVGLAFLAGGAPLCALVPRGGLPPERLPDMRRWLVVGGEANGIRTEWLDQCTERVTLPMPGGAESLNAAVAGAITCYILMRSRS